MMGMLDMFKGKSDGIAYGPTRNGMAPMKHADGRPVLLSHLTKDQRKGMGMGGATKRAPRAERKARTGFGSAADRVSKVRQPQHGRTRTRGGGS
jgi:hypothetical protein